MIMVARKASDGNSREGVPEQSLLFASYQSDFSWYTSKIRNQNDGWIKTKIPALPTPSPSSSGAGKLVFVLVWNNGTLRERTFKKK
jgi:hypothetical protein